MGALAISFGIASALAFSIASWGPDRLARIVGLYLFWAWMISNVIFVNNTPQESIILFGAIDVPAVIVLVVVWLRWPSVWLGVLVTALLSQCIFQAVYLFGAPSFANDWRAILVNNLLFALQLGAVIAPTFTRRKSRRSPVDNAMARTRRHAVRPPRVRDGQRPHLRLVA